MLLPLAACLFALLPSAGVQYQLESAPPNAGEQRAAGGQFVLDAIVGSAVIGRAAGGAYVLDAGPAPAFPAVSGSPGIFSSGFEF
jgi:hypothetical protein